MVRPITVESERNRRCHSSALRMATLGPPGRSSSSTKSRPIAGATPRTRKVFHDRYSPWIRSGAEQPERIQGEYLSWNTFRVLGVAPAIGRDFVEEEERPGGPKVAILSALLWQRLFRSDSTVIGRTIVLNGDPYTVVGVMPVPHQFPDASQLWAPITLDPAKSRG